MSSPSSARQYTLAPQLRKRRCQPQPLTAPPVAFGLMDLTLLAFGWAMTNPDFRAIIAKEDNVPIVMLLAAVGLAVLVACTGVPQPYGLVLVPVLPGIVYLRHRGLRLA